MEFDPLPQQRLAIAAPLGPVLVVAGPGAGKTFCLIARINHLIATLGIAPERICAVTFTNRAAEEIAVRLKHTLEDRADGITRRSATSTPVEVRPAIIARWIIRQAAGRSRLPRRGTSRSREARGGLAPIRHGCRAPHRRSGLRG